MEYAAGMVIVRTIGVDVTMQCIGALTGSVKGICGLIVGLQSCDEVAGVLKFIRDTDLERKVRLLERIITDIDLTRHTASLSMSIEDVRECLGDIEKVLTEMQTRITYNRSLWLMKSMRSHGFTDILERIRTLTQNLEDRKKALFEVISINDHLGGKGAGAGGEERKGDEAEQSRAEQSS